ncbi:DNA helicase PriA [Nonlabens ponticola]|uniref:DNA helicase PriA n=1 Tax=Nonlabens ponticola TaxID=2496866 RepID=A0A3S9MVT8_9FLAO|nr:DNA helicase PriA [Nonlabens ponticola]AZQ43345.1 DNA helicase PriA [Nonlabens ponticola]
MNTSTLNSERKKSCINCGAELTYEPGTDTITCDYCGHKEEIDQTVQPFEELELHKYLDSTGSQSHSVELSMLQCSNCGATQHIEENYKSVHCVYCTSPLIIEDQYQEEWILPGAVLPFQFKVDKAHQIFKKWVDSLWWAPNNLQRASLNPEYTKGLYVPYWTFDAQLVADYKGQRGDHYYIEVSRGSGKNRRTERERRTDWSPASGTVSGLVDDTLVKASQNKSRQIPAKVSRWKLEALKTFDTNYLAGYVTEKYTIPLKDGHLTASEKAKEIAINWIRRDIGGDEQRITKMDMKLSDETFKHVLLPLYISSYQFDGKRYNFYINGQTGAIHGDRPYSFWKIFLAILAAVIVIGTIVYLTNF